MQKLGCEIKKFLKEFDGSDLSWSVAKERRFEIDFSDLEDEEIYDISGEEWGAFSPDTDKNKKISFLSLFKTWNKNQIRCTMKVYLLFSGEYEDEQLHGCFASREDAERARFLLALDTEGDIQEWDVTKIPPLPDLKGKYPFKISIHTNLNFPIYVEKGWENVVSSLSSVEETYTFSQDTQRYEFYIFASNKQDAQEKAMTKLSSL